MPLDDLSTNPTPLPDDLEAFAVRCEELAQDDPTSYAADFLNSVAQTVRETLRVTDRQRAAIENIVKGARTHERVERRGSRRYEGWGRSR